MEKHGKGGNASGEAIGRATILCDSIGLLFGGCSGGHKHQSMVQST